MLAGCFGLETSTSRDTIERQFEQGFTLKRWHRRLAMAS
jgi:hypothetical protein